MIVGLGIDIIEIERIREGIERFQQRFLKRFFTEIERKYCEAFQDPYPHYAVRFAAKEAAMKALGVGIFSKIPWTDFEVRNEKSGKPYLVLHGKASQRARELGARSSALSLSHNRTQACAVVILSTDENEAFWGNEMLSEKYELTSMRKNK